MKTQLRIYTINRGQLHQFAQEWKEMVLPLRIEHGFNIESAWTIESTNQFVWLLSYDGEDWKSKEDAYYTSAARKSMEPNPARLIARPEHFDLEGVI